MSYGAGNHDIYLLKADDMGNQQWFKTFGGSGLDVGFSGQQAADGGYIITGYTSSYGAGYYDIYLIKTEDETGELILALLPVNPPIIIPAGGGSFNFVADITNLNNTPTVFDAWTEVSIPGIIDPRSLRLREGQMIQGYGNMTSTLTQYVHGSAPAGIYTYRGFVGTYPDYVTACDSFTFDKTGVSEGFDKSQSWMVEDWNNESISANPVHFNLLSVSPNPFNEKTVISFQLPAASPVELAIYDISGREVQSLVNGHWSLGKHSVVWEAKGMASGIYLIRMKAGDFSQVQKVVLMK
jgi:hypothetical protein